MRVVAALIIALQAAATFAARADIGVEHTRVVYKAGQSATNTRIWNKGQQTSLVQAWIDDGDDSAAPESLKVPFVVAPSVFRLEPGRSRDIVLRAIGGNSLPADRESVFWLNVLDVPARVPGAGGVSLDYAVRWRAKLFYRPSGLPGRADDAAGSLHWSIREEADGGLHLIAHNPTPFHVSLDAVVLAERKLRPSAGGNLVHPLGEWSMPLEPADHGAKRVTSLQATWLDDAGKPHSREFSLVARP